MAKAQTTSSIKQKESIENRKDVAEVEGGGVGEGENAAEQVKSKQRLGPSVGRQSGQWARSV